LEIVAQVTAGLVAVHKQKLVHRDIKPGNIMVSLEEGGAVSAKIIDLGLAKSLDEPGTQTAISTPGAFAGTPETPALNSLPDSRLISARICIRLGRLFGRC
jgi:serine/threonine protein kinase